MFRRVIESRVRVSRLTLAAQRKPAPGMQIYIAGKKTSRSPERDMSLHRLIEILAGNAVQAVGNPRAQRIRQIHLLARDIDLHRRKVLLRTQPPLSRLPTSAWGCAAIGRGDSPKLGWHGLLPLALHGAGDAQRLPVFGHRPTRNVHALLS